MRMDLFPLTEFSKKNLEDCQKWRDENYERNTKRMSRHIEVKVHTSRPRSKFLDFLRSFQRFCRLSEHLHHALGRRLLWLLLFHLRNLSLHLGSD